MFPEFVICSKPSTILYYSIAFLKHLPFSSVLRTLKRVRLMLLQILLLILLQLLSHSSLFQQNSQCIDVYKLLYLPETHPVSIRSREIVQKHKHMLRPELLISHLGGSHWHHFIKCCFCRLKHILIVKTCIKIIDVLSYSDLREMKNTDGNKHLTVYTLGYRMIQLFNAFLQYFGQIDLLSNY